MADKPNYEEAILRWPDVEARVGISRSHAHALASRGLFPKPIKLVPGASRASGWLKSEIDQYLIDRVRESREGAGQFNDAY